MTSSLFSRSFFEMENMSYKIVLQTAFPKKNFDKVYFPKKVKGCRVFHKKQLTIAFFIMSTVLFFSSISIFWAVIAELISFATWDADSNTESFSGLASSGGITTEWYKSFD